MRPLLKHSCLVVSSILFFLILLSSTSFSQTNRLKRIELNWNLYTKVQKNHLPYIAYTTHKTLYKYKATQVGAQIKLDFIIDVMLDAAKTQVDINRLNSLSEEARQALLKHEQGHADLAVSYGRELLKRLKAGTYTIRNYQEKTRSIYQNLMKELSEANIKYDAETAHGEDQEQQVKWNTIFKNKFAK